MASEQQRPKVGVVGVGRMGASMALHLRDLGYTIAAVYDERPELRAEVAAALHAIDASTPAQVTAASETVITVVSDDRAMDAIFARTGDSLLCGARDRVFINCATVTPALQVEIERRAEAAGAHSIEACMASSIPQAREGRLYLMVAGKPEVVERVQPLLRDLSAQLRYLGGAGEAAKVKALVNMVMNANTAALAEGLGLGEALGLDLDVLREVFSQTGAASRVLETDGEDMQLRRHDVYFSAAHAAKDSHIALALARGAGLELPVAAAAGARFDRLVELGLGELDKSGVAELTFSSRRARDAAADEVRPDEQALELEHGGRTILEHWGESGPNLLCIHGMTSSRKGWLRLANRFFLANRVWAYDQRGHGDSAGVVAPMTLEQGVRDLERVAAAIPGGVDALVGHSWGGTIALLGGLRVRPRRVIAIDPTLRIPPGLFFKEYVDGLRPLFDRRGAQREEAILEAYAGYDELDMDGKIHAMRTMTIEPIERLGTENRVEAGGWDIREQLTGYPIPLLLCVAGKDSVMSAQDVQFVRERGGRNVTIEIFENEGHSLHRSAFEAFSRILEAFL